MGPKRELKNAGKVGGFSAIEGRCLYVRAASACQQQAERKLQMFKTFMAFLGSLTRNTKRPRLTSLAVEQYA